MTVKLANRVWQDVKNDLIRRITGREFELHSRFFSFTGLSREYGISDITSRRVIRELVKEGYIESVPGRGSFIRSCLEEKKIVLLAEKTPEITSDDALPNVISEVYKGMLFQCAKMNADIHLSNP